MAVYREAKCKLCRREGAKLFLKGDKCYMEKCPFNKRPVAPGQHGAGRKKVSEYGLQLREKQKTKRIVRTLFFVHHGVLAFDGFLVYCFEDSAHEFGGQFEFFAVGNVFREHVFPTGTLEYGQVIVAFELSYLLCDVHACGQYGYYLIVYFVYLHPDGSFAARKVELFSDQGAYASHGHSIVAKAMGSFPQHYPCDNMECDAWTVFTNRPAAGAMRGYGMPQASFADESNVDDCAKAVGMDPLAFRMQNIMPQGYEDGFSHNVNYDDSFRQCLEAGKKYIDYDRKLAEFAKDTGPVRRGIGVATFWYNTAVYPISLETSSNRMQLNLDGSVTMQCGETEIGQGADTVYAQMKSEAKRS